jgi:type IV pilus assembly protein PilA
VDISYKRVRGRPKRGFTLIELLVVVLILAVLMAVSIPLYLSAVADAQRKTCRSNMQTIANSVHAARVKSQAPDFSGFMGAVSSANEPDLTSVPICPSSGTYTIENGNSGNTTTFRVRCNASGHGTFQPGVDST